MIVTYFDFPCVTMLIHYFNRLHFPHEGGSPRYLQTTLRKKIKHDIVITGGFDKVLA